MMKKSQENAAKNDNWRIPLGVFLLLAAFTIILYTIEALPIPGIFKLLLAIFVWLPLQYQLYEIGEQTWMKNKQKNTLSEKVKKQRMKK